MTKITALIVDDEPLALKVLRAKLEKIANVEIIGECNNGREAVKSIADLSPDVVFLDIQMPGVDGFGVIKQVQSEVMPLVVFTTAFQQYAIDAFEVHAVDYILKPIDLERLQTAIHRVEERMKDEDFNRKNRIISAIDSFRDIDSITEEDLAHAAGSNLSKKIMVKDRGQVTLLEQWDIHGVEGAGVCVCIKRDSKNT